MRMKTIGWFIFQFHSLLCTFISSFHYKSLGFLPSMIIEDASFAQTFLLPPLSVALLLCNLYGAGLCCSRVVLWSALRWFSPRHSQFHCKLRSGTTTERVADAWLLSPLTSETTAHSLSPQPGPVCNISTSQPSCESSGFFPQLRIPFCSSLTQLCRQPAG